MLLKSKDGIRCDLCGTPYRENFTYYSCDGSINVIDVSKHLNNKTSQTITFDMCSNCYSKYTDIILNNVKKIQPGKIKDDFSDAFYTKTAYAKIILTKVVVAKEAKNGVMSSNEDIDIVVAGESLKNLSKQIIEVRGKYSEKEDEWTAKT